MTGDARPSKPLRQLGEELHDEALRSSARLLILLSLGLNRRIGFSELLELTRVGKGSLSHHLSVLSDRGLVVTRTVFSLGGPRVAVEITPKGEEAYLRLVGALTDLPRSSNAAPEFRR